MFAVAYVVLARIQRALVNQNTRRFKDFRFRRTLHWHIIHLVAREDKAGVFGGAKAEIRYG